MKHSADERESYSGGYTTCVSHLRRLGANDDAAWNEFYIKYREMIFKIGAERQLSDNECEDLMQEVALICSRKLQNFVYDPGRCRFRRFLYRVARNVSFNLVRKKDKNTFDALDDDYCAIPELDIQFMQEYEQFLLERSFAVLKDSISSESFLAFDMLFVQNLPIKEVVMQTGLSASALYTLKHRCLKKLRGIISDMMMSQETPPEIDPEIE